MRQQRTQIIAACLAGALLALASAAARAQSPSGEPIRIGYGIAQTGALSANGRSALLAQKTKRPVKLRMGWKRFRRPRH